MFQDPLNFFLCNFNYTEKKDYNEKLMEEVALFNHGEIGLNIFVACQEICMYPLKEVIIVHMSVE